MVTILDSSLRQNVWESVYDLATTSIATSDAIVTAAYIDSQPQLNQVVINPIDKSENAFTVDTTRNVTTKTIVVNIDIYTKGKDSSKNIDILSDKVENIFKTNQIDGITLISFSSNFGFIYPNDNKVKLNTITLTFMRR